MKLFHWEVVEDIKTHVLCSINCCVKTVPFIRQNTDDNVIQYMHFACTVVLIYFYECCLYVLKHVKDSLKINF